MATAKKSPNAPTRLKPACRRSSHTATAPALCLAAGLLVGVARAEEAPPPQVSPALSVWDVSTRVETGFGYRENILLTRIAPESSAFFKLAGDVSLVRLSESGSELTLLFLGEDMEYLNTTSVNGERFATATANLTQPLGSRDTFLSEFSYLYQYQVLDVSEIETDLNRVLVEGHNLSLAPGWRHSFSPTWALHVAAVGLRQFYQGELDDFWEVGGKAGAVRAFGDGSEVGLWFKSVHWLYDTRQQTGVTGVSIPDTSLTYWRPEVSLQWRQNWDKAKNLRTVTKLAWLHNSDNGSGYYDYHRLTAGEHLRWRYKDLELTGGVRAGWYRYDVQRIAGELRDRTYVEFNVRSEYRFSRRGFLFVEADREWNFSNDPIDEYEDWRAAAGIGFEY
jgi:hypothetical protein